MERVTASEAKQTFGRLMDTARREPVLIERNGRPFVVVLSHEDYERLEAAEDALWGRAAAEADARGDYLTPEESEAVLQEIRSGADR